MDGLTEQGKRWQVNLVHPSARGSTGVESYLIDGEVLEAMQWLRTHIMDDRFRHARVNVQFPSLTKPAGWGSLRVMFSATKETGPLLHVTVSTQTEAQLITLAKFIDVYIEEIAWSGKSLGLEAPTDWTLNKMRVKKAARP